MYFIVLLYLFKVGFKAEVAFPSVLDSGQNIKQIKINYQGATYFIAHSGWKVGVKAGVGKVRPAKTFCTTRGVVFFNIC